MDSVEQQAERPSPVGPDLDLGLSDAILKFLGHCRVGKCLSANTLRAYESDLSGFAATTGATRPVRDTTREGLRDFAGQLFDRRQLKATTVKRRMASLKVFFRWLEFEGHVPLSPFHRLDLPIRLPKRLPRALDAEEMRNLLRQADREVRSATDDNRQDALLAQFAVTVLFTTGLRVSELTAARVSDVTFPESSIQVRGKGNRERRVYLPGLQATKLLAKFLIARRRVSGSSDRLLVRPSGAVVTAAWVRKQLRSQAERAGITRRVTPHMLRHTAATQLLEADVDIRFVQRLLGHASIATTQIYAQVSDRALRMRLVRANTLLRVKSGRR